MKENMKISSSPERELSVEEKIDGFKKNFDKLRLEDKELAEKLRERLVMTAGVSEYELDKNQMLDEDYYYSIVSIPADDLDMFGTSCGYRDNLPFTKSVIKKIKESGVGSVVAISYGNEAKILAAAMKIDGRNGEIIAKMVCKNKGSWRGEASGRLPGWVLFESE